MAAADRIRIKGISIREEIQGEGEPVLMVHGWGANIELLQPLAQRLSRLGFRCYMLDLPGFGESDEPPAAYSVSDYAAFCLAYLDHHGLGTAHYFGHSLGGRIGLALAADHDERIKKMALSNSAGIRIKPSLHSRMRLNLYRGMRAGLEAVGAKSAALMLRAQYSRRYGSLDFQAASPVMRQTLIKVVNQDLLECAARVAAPTILIWGDQDEETPLWMGRKLEETIPDAALVVHAGAGHYAYLDFPDKTASILQALFRSA